MLIESSAFLDRVGSSKLSSDRFGVLIKLIRTWRLLISSLLRIRSWERVVLGGWVLPGVGGEAAAWL